MAKSLNYNFLSFISNNSIWLISSTECLGPSNPLLFILDEEIKEQKVIWSKSSQTEIKFTARFKNDTAGDIDLIWKDYDGEEIVIRKNLRPGDSHEAVTFYTHPFIARHSETRHLKSFTLNSTTAVVFEGIKFGVIPNSFVEISVCEGVRTVRRRTVGQRAR